MDSNVERLPYLAQKLKENTPRIKSAPATDRDLFIFAQDENWQQRLDPKILAQLATLLKDYSACLSRIRARRAPAPNRPKQKDVNRILFARGQEDMDSDTLYALFQALPPERVSALRQAITAQAWRFMDGNTREAFLLEFLPELERLHDLLADFRCGGYRILGDLVCDVDDENTARNRKTLCRDGDSPAFSAMMRAFTDKPAAQPYRDAVSLHCRALLERIVPPGLAVRYVVALGKRELLWELLLNQIEKNVQRRESPC